MVRRVLVTTALEETWPRDTPVLFLGEWCRLHARRDRWDDLDGKVLPYHWDDRVQLFADYQELQAFYERLLLDIVPQLNQMHGVDHGQRYWRILIGPWLNCFTQVLFDRWTTVQQAVRDYAISNVRVLNTDHAAFVPNCMADYTEIVLHDEGNEQIYATLLREFTDVSVTVLDGPVTGPREAGAPHPPAQEPSRTFKSGLMAAYTRIAKMLSRDSDAVIFMADLTFANAKALALRLRQVPQVWRALPPAEVATDMAWRQWRVDGEDFSPFEAAARRLIPRYMPKAYLEGYQALHQQATELPWPKRPKLIYTTTGQYTLDVFKAWAAEKVEAGAKLVIGQHGGQYGIGKWVIHEDHETAIADRFLSWGWSKPEDPKVKPVGLLKMVRPLDVDHAEQPHALLAMASLPRYSYWLRSITIARQWLDYFNDQRTFVEHLPKSVRNALIVRLHHKNYGWDQEGRWRAAFADVKLDCCEREMHDLIARCRVFITTYNATTYLESFAMNVPTVIHWNPEQWELRDSAVPYFEGLKRVGVFHDTPQSAARHVAAIWDDVGAWWNSAPVREEVARFSRNYGHVSEHLLTDIEHALKEATAPQMAHAG